MDIPKQLLVLLKTLPKNCVVNKKSDQYNTYSKTSTNCKANSSSSWCSKYLIRHFQMLPENVKQTYDDSKRHQTLLANTKNIINFG